MLRITVHLHGHLYWYADKKKELEVTTTKKTLQEIIEDIGVPMGEVSMVIVNGVKKKSTEIPSHDDILDVYPIVGGG